MCPRPQYTDLTYMGGTRPCGPMSIIFGSVIQTWYTSLHAKFGANRTFYVPKTPVQQFGLYESYQSLWTDIANFQIPMAKFEIRSSLRSDTIVITMDGRTDRHSSNVSKEPRVTDQYFYAS